MHRRSGGQPLRRHGTLTPEEWAQIIVREAEALGYTLTRRQLAEGLGVLQAESNFNASSKPAGNDHIGAWAEEPGFGSEAERLDPSASTRAALKRWKADGESWWPAWGKWEKGETEGAGPARYKKFLETAEGALRGYGLAAGKGPQPSRGSRHDFSRAPEGVGGDLMHAGLVGVLVLGGIGLIGFGATRMLGASAAGKAASSQ